MNDKEAGGNDDNKDDKEDQTNDDSDDGGGAGTTTKFKPKKINIDRIAHYIVGLATYESKIDDEKLNKYMTFSESHNKPSVGIWILIA